MKPKSLSATSCLLLCLGWGLASGGAVDMHKYYGPGPYVEPPYWAVPDLTKKSRGETAVSDLDLTHKQVTQSAYPDLSPRNGKPLQGRPAWRRYAFSYSHTYGIYSRAPAFGVNLTAARPRPSVWHIKYGPSSPANISRYPSYRTYDERANYGNAMQRYMQGAPSMRPR